MAQALTIADESLFALLGARPFLRPYTYKVYDAGGLVFAFTFYLSEVLLPHPSVLIEEVVNAYLELVCLLVVLQGL